MFNDVSSMIMVLNFLLLNFLFNCRKHECQQVQLILLAIISWISNLIFNTCHYNPLPGLLDHLWMWLSCSTLNCSISSPSLVIGSFWNYNSESVTIQNWNNFYNGLGHLSWWDSCPHLMLCQHRTFSFSVQYLFYFSPSFCFSPRSL